MQSAGVHMPEEHTNKDVVKGWIDGLDPDQVKFFLAGGLLQGAGDRAQASLVYLEVQPVAENLGVFYSW